MHAEYVRIEEYLVQREQCMLNTLDCRNAWCRGSYASMFAVYAGMQECVMQREQCMLIICRNA